MRTVLTCYALLIAFLVGAGIADYRHAGDYAAGYDDGFRIGSYRANKLTDADMVTRNLLCRYAEVACGAPK